MYRVAPACLCAALFAGCMPMEDEASVAKRSIFYVTCLGSRPNGGYQVRIDGVTADSPESVNVSVQEWQAGDDCVVTDATVQPYHVILVNRPLTSATFTLRTEVVSCSYP